MKKYSLAAIALLAVFVCDALAASLSGRVVGVSDGDTVTVLTAEKRSGTFDTINKTFSKTVTPTYNPSNVSLALSPVLNEWIFNGSDSWNNAARWSLGHVPLADEDVRIDQPGI